MGLVARVATGTQLLQGHHQLDRVEHADDARELCGRQAPSQSDELVARHVDVDQHPREALVREPHRLRRDVEVDAVGDEEAVDHVELGGVPPVEPDDDAVLYHELGLGIQGPAAATSPSSGQGSTSSSRRSSDAPARRSARSAAPQPSAASPRARYASDASRTNVALRDAPSSSSRDAHASSSTGEERPGRSAV